MKYYAKSPTFILKEYNKEQILKKLDDVINIFCDELEGEDINLLQDYRKKLLTENIEVIQKCAKDFFELYGKYFSETDKKLIIHACKLHDIGKANYIFQTKVNPDLKKEKTPQIPHGFLSAIILSKKIFLNDNLECNLDDFKILLTAIYFHHNRPDVYKANEIKDYCEQFYLKYLREYLNNNDINIHITNRNSLLFSNQKDRTFKFIDENVWCKYMLIKGMLNKFDWTVSAGYESAEISIDMIEKRLFHNIEKKWGGKFRPAQEFMIENKYQNVFFFAHTGNVKTEAALIWINV